MALSDLHLVPEPDRLEMSYRDGEMERYEDDEWMPRFMPSGSPQSEDPDTRHRTPAPTLATSRRDLHVCLFLASSVQIVSQLRDFIRHRKPPVGLILTYCIHPILSLKEAASTKITRHILLTSPICNRPSSSNAAHPASLSYSSEKARNVFRIPPIWWTSQQTVWR